MDEPRVQTAAEIWLEQPGMDDIEIVEVVGMDPDPSEPVAAEPAEPGTEAPAESEAVERNAQLTDQLRRLQAEFANYKRRIEREAQQQEQQATLGLVNRLLPVLDNFERALALEPSQDNEESLRDGVILIFRQLLDELRKEGLEAIESVGEPFDPTSHEAVATDADCALGDNVVTEELQRGYRLRGRLLRPARVTVSVDPHDPAA